MSDGGNIFTCPNHPNLRWFNTGPGKKICFMGEIQEDGSLKEDYTFSPGSPLAYLKARLDGKNPFNTHYDDPGFTTWEEVVDYVHAMVEMSEKYAFECDCPDQIVTLPNEDYASVQNRPSKSRSNQDAG